MLKHISNLSNAQELSKKELQSINGGYACIDGWKCPVGTYCDDNGLCRRN
ncbi:MULTISPECIES: bacteriocin [unclassified Flavobacterium]